MLIRKRTCENKLIEEGYISFIDKKKYLEKKLKSILKQEKNKDSSIVINLILSIFDGAGGETRTLTWLPIADFESAASAIPPHRLCRIVRISERCLI